MNQARLYGAEAQAGARNGAQMERFLRNLGAVEGYRPGPEHYGDDKVLPGLTWCRILRQGKPGKSLTAPSPFNDAECPATLFVKYLAKN